jgi:hypothetical protein
VDYPSEETETLDFFINPGMITTAFAVVSCSSLKVTYLRRIAKHVNSLRTDGDFFPPPPLR